MSLPLEAEPVGEESPFENLDPELTDPLLGYFPDLDLAAADFDEFNIVKNRANVAKLLGAFAANGITRESFREYDRDNRDLAGDTNNPYYLMAQVAKFPA